MDCNLAYASILLLPIFVVAFQRGAIAQSAADQRVIRAGMIGLDTSHVPAFAKMFNADDAAGDLGRVRIVAGYPGGTDLPASKNRVEGFTNDLHQMGIEIVPTIAELLQRVDVVLLESVDGRIHFQEARPVIDAGKPLYIDKPMAGSLAEVIAIFELAKRKNVPCFSSSSLRYVPGVTAIKQNQQIGDIVGAVTWGPCSYQEGLPDMYNYGVHGVEALFALMGTGCESITRAHTEDTDVITGVWKDGRVGTYRGIRRHKGGFGAVAFGSDSIVTADNMSGYGPLCEVIAKFFVTGEVPVSSSETVELFAFLDAADISKQNGGGPVSIADTISNARQQAMQLIEP
ncbi:MAG: gfo/Idh/MocA family oxidoreductase [Planctomycetales bacterium]|nr:gfo/Idh/MocA family oxidoreductase [Planctomycetales bacterium]